METEIKLEEINPFVRYVHTFGPKNFFGSRLHAPCDARCFLVRHGEAEVVTANATYKLCVGQMLLIPAGYAYYLSKTGDADILGINFDYTRYGAHRKAPVAPVLSEQFKKEDQIEQITISDHAEFQSPLYVCNAAGLLDLAEQIESEFVSARAFADAVVSAKMKLLLIGAIECLYATHEASKTVEAVISYVQQHCTERISNSDIGQALNFHPNYLNRLMQRHTGKSLHAYLVHCRVNRAAGLLQMTNSSIGEIATASGFGDVQQFSKIFRQVTGYTPGEFRRMLI